MKESVEATELKPLNSRILVRLIEEQENFGVIVSLADGLEGDPKVADLVPGDLLLWEGDLPTFVLNGTTYAFVPFEGLVGVVKGE